MEICTNGRGIRLKMETECSKMTITFDISQNDMIRRPDTGPTNVTAECFFQLWFSLFPSDIQKGNWTGFTDEYSRWAKNTKKAGTNEQQVQNNKDKIYTFTLQQQNQHWWEPLLLQCTFNQAF